MKKVFCDACFLEISNFEKINEFSYLCHLDSILTHEISNYVDHNNNPISRTKKFYDLCNSCYNRIMIESLQKFYEINKASKESSQK